MGLFGKSKTKYDVICSTCGTQFKSDFKPTDGQPLNCKKCDELVLVRKLAKETDESKRKALLDQLVIVRSR